jgi:hypothetical protein
METGEAIRRKCVTQSLCVKFAIIGILNIAEHAFLAIHFKIIFNIFSITKSLAAVSRFF